MGAADFWQNADRAREATKQAADLRSEVAVWEDFLKEIQDVLDMAELAESEGIQDFHEEVTKKLQELQTQFAKLEFATLFSGPYDTNNAIVSIQAGSGGTEAQDWAEMLMRMLMRFCEIHKWETQVLWDSYGQEAGIKGITFRVIGRHAYGYLQSESGVHRLVRISPFDADQLRHTSFASVEVLPEIEDLHEVDIDPKDLRIDTFCSGGAGGQNVNKVASAVRIVHIPTGIMVACQNERSQHQNREMAMKILMTRLHQLHLKELQDEKQKLRGEYKSAEWGNQIRSYVLHPYQMVKDHRTEYETSNTQGVLDGHLDEFVEAYLRYRLQNVDRFAG